MLINQCTLLFFFLPNAFNTQTDRGFMCWVQHLCLVFLTINFNMCFGCSKNQPSHGDISFEYPQHMFWLIIKK